MLNFDFAFKVILFFEVAIGLWVGVRRDIVVALVFYYCIYFIDLLVFRIDYDTYFECDILFFIYWTADESMPNTQKKNVHPKRQTKTVYEFWSIKYIKSWALI